MRSRTLAKLIPLLCLACLLATPVAATGCAPGGGGDGDSAVVEAEYHWRLATPWTEKTRNESMQLFNDLVNYYSGGRIEMEFFPDGVLGSHNEIFHAVQQGDIEMSIFAPYVDLVPGGMINWVPFTVETFDQAAMAYDIPNGPIHRVAMAAWEEVGCHLMWTAALGAYGISNRVRPLETPADFENWKFRVSGSTAYVMAMANMSEGTGMTLETIPWADLYNALERGVVDGCWAAYGHLVDARIGEVTSYYTELGLGWDASNIAMNLELWESLPADLQDAITLAAIRAQERDIQAERKNTFVSKEWVLNNTDIVVTELTPEERAVFREKANMGEVWAELVTPWLDEHYPGENMTQTMFDELDYIKSIVG